MGFDAGEGPGSAVEMDWIYQQKKIFHSLHLKGNKRCVLVHTVSGPGLGTWSQVSTNTTYRCWDRFMKFL